MQQMIRRRWYNKKSRSFITFLRSENARTRVEFILFLFTNFVLEIFLDHVLLDVGVG